METELDTSLEQSNQLRLKPKMAKFEDDPCFGLLHEQVEQCNACWIKRSCATSFRNYTAKKKKK